MFEILVEELIAFCSCTKVAFHTQECGMHMAFAGPGSGLRQIGYT
jgi:hypothetical protein